jgi:hypothetical protein
MIDLELNDEQKSKQQVWLRWANEKANSLDPIVSGKRIPHAREE